MTAVQRSLLRSGVMLSVALMAGRLAGFVRELVLASAFGLSAQADVAIVLLTLPDLLVNLLLSGGLSVALIPALRGGDPERRASLFAQASLAVTALFGLLAMAFVWEPSLWLGLLAPGTVLNDLPVSNWTWAALAVALPLTALSGVSSAALNADDRFFVAGCGTLMFNLCVIAALLLGLTSVSDATGGLLLMLCLGIASGTLLRWLSQMLALGMRAQWSFKARLRRWLLDRALMRTFGAGLASASLLVLVPVLIRACASWLGEGQLAAFNYAIKLVELPIGILITPLATVAFPRLSELVLRGDTRAFAEMLGASLRRNIVLSLVVVLCGWQFGDAVVALLLGHGRLRPEEQTHVLRLMQVALLSAPFVGLTSLATAALNARRQAGAVLRCSTLALLALPLMCLPGLHMNSAQALMWALPGTHLLLTLLLFRALDLHRSQGICQSGLKIILPLVAVTLPWVAGMWLDDRLRLALEGWPVHQLLLMRAVLAIVVFLVAAMAGMRVLRLKARGEEGLER